MTKFRVFSPAVGRPGSGFYRAREDFGTVEAPSAMRALDILAGRIGVPHIERHHSIAVLGVGSIKVEPVEPGGEAPSDRLE